MAGTLLQTVLKMSFTGSTVILIVLAARAMLHKAPKIFSYLLWSVVLFRLLCPVSFLTHMSVFQFMDIPRQTIEKSANIKKSIQDTTHMHETGQQVQDTVPQKHMQNNKGQKMPGTQSPYSTFLLYGTVIWFTGITIMLTLNAVSLLRLHKLLLATVPINHQVFLSDYISSPFVYGILHPRIYLPSSLSVPGQEYIILHEQIHIRRKDYLVKLLAFAALTIHWFNPLVWLAFHLFEKDMEMSCDEAVIKKTGSSIRPEYSASLLKLATSKKTFTKTLAAFGESETGSRIKHIMGYKKPATAIIVIAAIILIATFIFAGGNPPQKNMGKVSSKNFKNTSASNSGNNTENQPSMNTANPETATEPGEWWQFWEDGSYIHTMDCAFLREMTEDTITADPIEYVVRSDTKRIKELGLVENDLITGYYYNNPDKTTITWKIDENTEFMFLDWWKDFKDDKNVIDTYGNPQHMLTYTKDEELFRRYLDNYKTSKSQKPLLKFPFFFEVENGVVKRVVEKFFI